MRTSTAAQEESPRGALDGLLVADFSRILAGPYLTMLLADLGASVIKVEPPEGDGTRQWGPPWISRESTYYKSINRSKRSVVLDLRNKADVALARELACRADVLIENTMPGKMASFGLSYDELSALNDGLVYCSISGFGSQEPAAALPGYDLLVQALGGLMSVTGSAGGPPLKVGVAVVDVICGLHAGLGIMSALSSLERTGRGQLVEVNLLLSVLSALTNQAGAYLLANKVPEPLGNSHPSVAPYGAFLAADGPLVIAVGTDRQFRSMCEVLGADALLADSRLATNAGRVAHRTLLSERLNSNLASRSRHGIAEKLVAAGVPAGPVNDVREAFEFAAAVGLGAIWTIDGESYVRTPIGMSATPPYPRFAPPALDSSGDEVREWLSKPWEGSFEG